ncbi:MAG: hypothetical protein JOY97_00200 [Hyphomicrobiales bacterium]|nr:hypothetical protein [Hyphomicrobiales bacterium]
MRQEFLTSPYKNGVRTRLTDPAMIATAAKLMREAGYAELVIWRHFIDAFAVDLDALSVIMTEIFGQQGANGAPRKRSPNGPEKPERLRAA